ncbi:hypothetical protein GW17_00049494 [Ensete ventricosum]|nr:hypothetical protein GW17_00049494 [Ensete ventricosum]
MHPLRFPNSGIKAKVYMRKISFKLCVIRLNRVESFYAFLLRFRSEDSEEEGRPATASPHIGPTTHGQVGCKGQPTATKAPASMCGQGCPSMCDRPQPGRRGWLPAARSQGAAPRPGLPPVRATAPAGAAPEQGGTARRPRASATTTA